jgi:AcrR family transcriptional regulator
MSQSTTTGREAIVLAAVRVILRDGVLALTLEAVAREARLSKGGLLYHFPNKDALIAGMIEHFLQAQDAELARRQQQQTPSHRSWLRAYLEASFADPIGQGLSASDMRRLNVALLAAVAINPRLLAPVQAWMQRWMEQLHAEQADPVDGLVCWLAADGMWLWDLFGLLPEDEELRRRLIERLQQLGREKL